MKLKKKHQRWYDAYPDISKSLICLQQFPPPMLGVIGEGLVHIAEGQFSAAQLLKSARSLGWETVSALYKSKRKQRVYDQSPSLHKTMNYMYLMSDWKRKRLSAKMLELVSFVYQYLKATQEMAQPVAEEELIALVNAYTYYGKDEAERFIVRFRRDAENRPQVPVPASKEGSDVVLDEYAGMSLKKNSHVN